MTTDLTRYLDGAETPNNTTLFSALRWDNHRSPMSEPLRLLSDCLGRFALYAPAPRRVLLHSAALKALLTHPTVLHEAEIHGHKADAQMVERYLRLPRGAVQEAPEMGTSVLILGETHEERYAIFGVIEPEDAA